MSDKPRVIIDLKAISHNYQAVQKYAGQAQCAAVVKSDAYGLGAPKISLLLEKEGCSTFFVSNVNEGIELRKILRKNTEVVILQGPNRKSLALFHKHNLVPVLNNIEQCSLWNADNPGAILPILNLDSGLNRMGLKEKDIEYLYKTMPGLLSKGIRMVMSQLSSLQEPNGNLSQRQQEQFDYLRGLLPLCPASLLTSNLYITGTKTYDVVRVGAALYGLTIHPESNMDIRPVVSVDAPVIHVGSLGKGEFVGYDAAYQASENKKYAILSIGYAQGIPESLSNKGTVWFGDEANHYAAPIIGKISMDILTCDISNVPENLVKIGKRGSLLTPYYTLKEMAAQSNSSESEILTHIGKQCERRYTQG